MILLLLYLEVLLLTIKKTRPRQKVKALTLVFWATYLELQESNHFNPSRISFSRNSSSKKFYRANVNRKTILSLILVQWVFLCCLQCNKQTLKAGLLKRSVVSAKADKEAIEAALTNKMISILAK